MKQLFKVALLFLAIFTSVAASAHPKKSKVTNATSSAQVVLGADRVDQYVPLLKGKRIGLLSNQTGITSKGQHVLDVMLENGLNVTVIFSPEHGFRGSADAGEHVSSSVDEKTGIPIASLYDGKSSGPSKESMDKFDVLVCDLQDVGLRFYTYYITMAKLMEACAVNDKDFVVFDRPNPNGMYVDGPILDMKLRSGVGRFPMCTVHGMTMGEIAQMANGEGWLKEGVKVKLTVVPCLNYTHQTRYHLPVAPSPNLPNMLSIYLYPSICYFEGTDVSLGRGTDLPFQGYGHPDMTRRSFEFTPTSRFGAKNPPQKDVLCHGVDLRNLNNEDVIAKGIDLTYVVDAYQDLRSQGKEFFPSESRKNFFNKLMGNTKVVEMLEAGKSAAEIKATWQDDVVKFKMQRKPYLLYAE